MGCQLRPRSVLLIIVVRAVPGLIQVPGFPAPPHMNSVRSLALPLFLFAAIAVPAVAQPMATLENPENVIWAMFSPDGKTLAVTMEGKHVYLVSVRKRVIRRILRGQRGSGGG